MLLALKMKEGIISTEIQSAFRKGKGQGNILSEAPKEHNRADTLIVACQSHFGLLTSRTVM